MSIDSTSPSNANMNEQSTTPTPQLPPEALELASRLFNMARENDRTLLQYIHSGIPPNLTNSAGDTLLMLSAYHGHADLVKGLIELGAQVDRLNGRGQSPLSGAVFKNHLGVVKVLIDNGADIRAGRPDSVQTAAMFKRVECCEMMGLTLQEALKSLPEGVFIGPHGDMS